MRKIKIFDYSTNYLDASGEMLSPDQIIEKYRLLEGQIYISEADSQDKILYGLKNLTIARIEFGIDEALSDEQAVSVIESKINSAIESRPLPTPSERTAAALEFIALCNI